MSQPIPRRPQSLLHTPEALLDQWRNTQQRTLDYLGNHVNLGVQGYQNGWQLSMEWMRELSASADFSDTPASFGNSMDIVERAQRVVIDRFDELDRLNREWWRHISATATDASQQVSPARPGPTKNRSASGTARAA